MSIQGGGWERIIHSYVKDQLPNQIPSSARAVDKEDAFNLVTCLVDVGLVQLSGLSGESPLRICPEFLKFRCQEFVQEGSRSRIVWAQIRSRGASSIDSSSTHKLFEKLAKLSRLETLVLRKWAPFSAPRALSRFPKLKNLTVLYYSKLSCHQGEGFFNPATVPEGTNIELEELKLFSYSQIQTNCLSSNDLEAFLLDITPVLPKLTRCSGTFVALLSFQRIAQRILQANINITGNNPQTTKIITSASRLRMLRLGWTGNTRIESSPEDTKVFLRAFPELETIVYGGQGPERADVQYLLDVNHAGRVLVEQKIDNARTRMPLSLWPTVLARASERGPDGIYYLLHNTAIVQTI